jgi:predicted RNase H-like HicB family nuclease
MKKPKIKITVTKEDTGYSATATADNNFIGTQGETLDELREMILEAINLTFEEKGFTYEFDELRFEYDLESFFQFYRVINVKALSQRIGMNQSLLSQYINGLKKPSKTQAQKILTGVQQIGRELSEAKFLL